MNSELISKIIEFKAGNPKNIFYKEAGEKIYKISIDYLYSGKRHQDNLVLSMAMMVEGRDNSTGGHIKRTSDVVKILLDEIVKDTSDDALKLSQRFYKKLIKAAPMHDLGKITVDDSILRKPGSYADEEFKIMKRHTTEGARIVHEILEETDD